MKYSEADGKWCKVEIMGHVEHIARAKEVDRLGGKMLRVSDETESEQIFYGLGAIFSIRWLTEEEGERQGALRLAEYEEQGKRHAHYRVIGAIQDTIRAMIYGAKVTPLVLKALVLEDHPTMTPEDFDEALDSMGPAEIDVDGVKMIWIDPDPVF